jgi:hypothetical protein
MKKYNRKAIFTELAKYCYLAGPSDFIEITEWFNGEGFDICISNKSGNTIFQLTHGELDALKKLIKEL